MRLLIIILPILLSCSRHKGTCKERKALSSDMIKNADKKNFFDTTHTFQVSHWEKIWNVACSRLYSNSRVLAAEYWSIGSAATNGLIYLPKDRKFYFFSFANSQVEITEYNDQLPMLKVILTQLDTAFVEKASFLMTQRERMKIMTHDASYLDIINIDLDKQSKSSTMFIKDYPTIVEDLSKL